MIQYRTPEARAAAFRALQEHGAKPYPVKVIETRPSKVAEMLADVEAKGVTVVQNREGWNAQSGDGFIWPRPFLSKFECIERTFRRLYRKQLVKLDQQQG